MPMSANVTHKHIWILRSLPAAAMGGKYGGKGGGYGGGGGGGGGGYGGGGGATYGFLSATEFWICIATLVFDISCPWALFLFSNIITTNILICF